MLDRQLNLPLTGLHQRQIRYKRYLSVLSVDFIALVDWNMMHMFEVRMFLLKLYNKKILFFYQGTI